MTQSPSDLQNILINELGVDVAYRHAPKHVTPDETLELSGAMLKWYAVHLQDRHVPTDIAQLARSYLKKTAVEARGFGFVRRSHRRLEQRAQQIGEIFQQVIACHAITLAKAGRSKQRRKK